MKDIYLLYHCDEWKDYSSMKLRMATTSLNKLKKEIIEAVKIKDMEFNDEDIKGFLKRTDSIRDMNTELNYGFVEEVTDGVRQ